MQGYIHPLYSSDFTSKLNSLPDNNPMLRDGITGDWHVHPPPSPTTTNTN